MTKAPLPPLPCLELQSTRLVSEKNTSVYFEHVITIRRRIVILCQDDLSDWTPFATSLTQFGITYTPGTTAFSHPSPRHMVH